MTLYILNQTTWRDMRPEVDKAREVATGAVAGLAPTDTVILEAWVVETLLKKIRVEEQFTQLEATPPN